MVAKIYILIVIFSLSLFTQKVIAQSQEIRCSTFEVNEQLKKQYPEYAAAVLQNEKAVTQWIKDHPHFRTRGNTTIIPIVIHLIYNPDSADQQLTDRQITSEIDVMNEDYNRQNADAYRTPSPFVPVAADCEINFCLAQRDPNGNTTTGIVRVENQGLTYFPGGSQSMKSSSEGGDDGWPYQNYLNIWVVPLEPGYLGYSTLPNSGSFTNIDGCVCHYKAFGRLDTRSKTYNLGRTGTHESGHWLDMIHTWGDDGGACWGSDSCADTPNQANSTFGCPPFPLLDNCSPNYPGVAYMDYMDYTNDSGMNMFTNDQKARMWAVLNTTRLSIQSSNGCNPPAFYQWDIGISAITQPTMTILKDSILPVVTLTNYGLETVTSATVYYSSNYKNHLYKYNWTGSLAQNEAINVTLPTIADSLGQQILIAYSRNPNGNEDADTTNDFRTRSYYVNYKPGPPITGDHFRIYNAESPNTVNLNYQKIVLSFDTLSVKDINEYEIVNVLGETALFSQSPDKISPNELELDVSQLPAGLYFIRVQLDKDFMVEKLLIMR